MLRKQINEIIKYSRVKKGTTKRVGNFLITNKKRGVYNSKMKRCIYRITDKEIPLEIKTFCNIHGNYETELFICRPTGLVPANCPLNKEYKNKINTKSKAKIR